MQITYLSLFALTVAVALGAVVVAAEAAEAVVAAVVVTTLGELQRRNCPMNSVVKVEHVRHCLGQVYAQLVAWLPRPQAY